MEVMLGYCADRKMLPIWFSLGVVVGICSLVSFSQSSFLSKIHDMRWKQLPAEKLRNILVTKFKKQTKAHKMLYYLYKPNRHMFEGNSNVR